MIVRRSSSIRGVAVFAGGTGGHLVPGLALCEHIRSSEPGCRVTLFRTGRGIEDRIVAASSIDTRAMELEAPGAGFSDRWRFARQIAREVRRAREFIRTAPVDAVVGLGGYPSVPGVVAARLEGLPLVLLEQNARPGKVNRYLGLAASAIACSDADGVAGFGFMRRLLDARLRETGNPLRSEVASARKWRESKAPGDRRRVARGSTRRRGLLVVGGSQGARALNEFIKSGLERLATRGDDVLGRIHVEHVTGVSDRDATECVYREHGIDAGVSDFEPALPRRLAEADLVVARAGGTTLAEIAAIGVPSVLVPYPGHRDHHQYENARALSSRGAAITAPESTLTESFFHEIMELLFDDERLARMELAARRGAHVDGVERVTDLIRSLVNDGDVR